LTVKGGDQLEDYPIEFIKSFLYGNFIKIWGKTYNPRQRLWERERSFSYFICDGCGKEKIFYATYPIEGSNIFGLYCWDCWKKRTGANKRVDLISLTYVFDDDDFINYIDFLRALENIKFTARQKHVLHFYMMDYSERMIAEKLELHQTTVHEHLKTIFKKIYEYLNGYPIKTPSQTPLIVRGNIKQC